VNLSKGRDWEAENKRKKIAKQGCEPVLSVQQEAEREYAIAVRDKSKAIVQGKKEKPAKSLVETFSPTPRPERDFRELQKKFEALSSGQKTSPWGLRMRADLQQLERSLRSEKPKRKHRALAQGET
jgi:hypothetical protein